MSSEQPTREQVADKAPEGVTNRVIERLAERLDELETRLAFQDDVIASLNDQVTRQELDLHRLWEAKRVLKNQLAELSPSNIKKEEDETAPPHY